jgi:ComF family protein
VPSRLTDLLQSLRFFGTRLSAALPSCCALCGATGGDALCGGCRAQYFGKPKMRCAQCAVAQTAPLCGSCLNNRPSFDATITATDYAPPTDQLVLALKFGSQLALAPLFARMLRDALTEHAKDNLPDVLTAVPLGARRLAGRGFNQALEIAKPLSRMLGIRLDPHLAARARETQPQSMLHPDERRSNVRHAFVVPQESIDRIRGIHVGVIDDVMTTGETLNELAATFKRFGAVRVTNLVVARTLPK